MLAGEHDCIPGIVLTPRPATPSALEGEKGPMLDGVNRAMSRHQGVRG